MATISLIVAAAANGVIGVDGTLPWRLSDDLRRFKALTMGKPIVMGRKTWESIGRALPGRHNIVMTRQRDFAAEGCTVTTSVGEALAVAGDAPEVMVIGGGEIYRLFLPQATRVYLTHVHTEIDGDARFPALDPEAWTRESEEAHEADAVNEWPFTFAAYVRSTGDGSAAQV